MLQLNNVTKVYGGGKNGVTALKNVSLDFGKKGLVVILGKSGCGKSTLLNIVGGLDKPTTGELVVNGRSARTFSTADYDAYRNTYVGMVFQEFNLIDEISVYQNIEITLKLQTKNTDVNSVDEVLKTVGLSNLGYRKPSELSGGQRQRVSLARALLKKPQILLADEPTGALDEGTSEEVFEVLKRLSETRLVVVVTHDRELAFHYGERIIEIVDGEVVSDKIREADTGQKVKRLCDNVIEVSAGGSVTPDALNALLDESRHNYIGISHDKDKIAIAYPETFDCFYMPKDKIHLKDTTPADIPEDDAGFSLKRGSLRIRDAFKMARINRKRTKKRFRFIAFMNMLCFAAFGLSYILSVINLPNVISKSVFDTNSQSVMAVTGLPESRYSYYYGNVPSLSENDVAAIEREVGTKKTAKVYECSLAPYYSSGGSSYSIMPGGDVYIINEMDLDITLETFTGVIETDSLSDLNLKPIANGGSTVCHTDDEIIISDFAAKKLMERGFFGLDADGRRGSFAPAAAADLVGMSVMIMGQNKYYKIAGVFETDYARYDYLHRAENRLTGDAPTQIQNWRNNKAFLYSKVIAKKGFVNTNIQAVTSGTIYLGGGDVQHRYYVNNMNDIKYTATNFSNPKLEPAFYWVEKNNLMPVIRESAPQIILSVQMFQSLFYRLESIDDAFDQNGNLYGQYQYLYLSFFNFYSEAQIVALYDEAQFPSLNTSMHVNAYLHRKLIANAEQNSLVLSSVMFDRGRNTKTIERLAETLLEKGYLCYSSAGSLQDLLEVGDMFDTAAKVFLYCSLGIAVFSFLLMLNYMSSMVRFRAKEIAVYRVIGASRMDVAKLFLAEGMFLVLVTTILSFMLTGAFVYFLTLAFKSSLQIFNLSFSILTFNLMTMLIMVGAIAFLVLLSTVIPVIAATRRKAIDSLKLID